MKKEESKAGFKPDPNSNSLSTLFEIFLRRIEPWPRVDSNEILDRRISKLKQLKTSAHNNSKSFPNFQILISLRRSSSNCTKRILRNPAFDPRIFQQFSEKRQGTERALDRWSGGKDRQTDSTNGERAAREREREGAHFYFFRFGSRQNGQRTNGRVRVRARLPPELASEYFAANADFANHLSIEPWLAPAARFWAEGTL